MPKKTTRQTKPSAPATASDLMAEAERRIAEARRENATELNLSRLGLTEAPSVVGELQQLKKLDLSENQLQELPTELSELRQLWSLDLRRNLFREVPAVLFELRQLQWLDLNSNQLQEIPKEFGELQQLNSLSLEANYLTTWPAVLGKLCRLQHLMLNRNQLISLPDDFGEMRQLQGLYLWKTNLAKLPDSFKQLQKLQRLNAQDNRLTEFPVVLCVLRQLRDLFLSNNQLTHLPSEVGQLQQLRSLLLDNNQLRELPATLGECKKVERFSFHGNPKLNIPMEMLGNGWGRASDSKSLKLAEVLDYYLRSKLPLLEAKLILVGRGAVGKTSLVNRLVHGTFDQVKKTEGIKITRWDVPLPNCQDHAHLNVWDFGGQEIMHATHQFFLTRRSLYLLVLSGREGMADQDAEYWLKLIESFGDESPVLVVLNKQREHPFDVNQRQLQGKYPFIRGFIKTDCDDRLGLDELHRRIKDEINALPHLRDGFPSEWFAVKDHLPRVKKSFLSFDEYRKACHRLKVKSEPEQKLLGRYLHDLGVMLNFREDERLQDTHVLKPQWVTEGIYTILNARLLDDQKGELRLRDLKTILPAKEYPANMHRFLLDLMKKFELCFTFPDDDAHYLIPELLDIQEPEAAAEFDQAQCLNFRYEYEVLPEGLLPRFIVRTHGLSENEARWRTGVILRFEEGRALVKADVVDKKVFIHVTGKSEARRRLLAVIRSDFERIHNDLKFKPAEMVPLHEHPDEAVTYDELLVYEQNGMKSFPKVIGKKVVQIDVQELLNGVDLEGTRRREDKREALAEMREEPIRVFISYAHRDERFRLALEPHLKLIQRQGLIAAWHDRLIKPGTEWKDVIDDNLERAKIILFLVSADFIASDYCYEIEMRRALERHKAGEACVIPIIVRDVNWKKAPFAKLNVLPKDGKAVAKWTDRDSAWCSVEKEIEEVATELRKKRARQAKE